MNGDSKPYFQPLSVRQDRDVVGRQRVLAGPEQVAELAEVDELHHLRLADDELRAALDFLVIVGKPVRQRVARVIGPLDDLDQLALDEVHQSHVRLLIAMRAVLQAAANRFERYSIWPMTDGRLIRVGVLGAGAWARGAHLPGYRRDPRCRVVAIADTELDRARQAARDFDIPDAVGGPGRTGPPR